MIVFLLNLFLIMAHSSGAVPFGEYTYISSSYLRYMRAARYPTPHRAPLVRDLCTLIRNRRVLRV
jgi:hypothetical protein